MSTHGAEAALPLRIPATRSRRTGAVLTLARRRAALTASNPRQIAVPMLGPIILALLVAPALKVATGGLHSGIDYQSFVGVGAVGLVIPLSCVFAGLSVIVDRHTGAQRELLAAPVPRWSLVAGNFAVALTLALVQAVVLVALTALRGGEFHVTASGLAWAVGAAVLFAICMYALAETLAAKIKTEEEYIGATPAVAIIPFFLAGAFFPIGALPGWITALAKVFPLTHALALMRYGLIDPSGRGLHDIWGMSDVTLSAALSLGVVALFAVGVTVVAVRMFTRSAVA